MSKLNKVVFFLLLLTISIGGALATPSHSASSIRAGTFGSGNFVFQATVNVTEMYKAGVEVATLNDLTSGNITVTSIITINNSAGATLSSGDAVKFTSYDSVADAELVGYASNNDSSNHADCLVLGAITSNSVGQCVISGKVTGVDTSAWSFGDDLYLNDTQGTLTNTKPTSAKCIQKIGSVLQSDASGIIFVSGANRCNDVPRDIVVTGDVNATGLGVFATVNTGQGNQEVYGLNTTAFAVQGNNFGVDLGLWTGLYCSLTGCSMTGAITIADIGDDKAIKVTAGDKVCLDGDTCNDYVFSASGLTTLWGNSNVTGTLFVGDTITVNGGVSEAMHISQDDKICLDGATCNYGMYFNGTHVISGFIG